MAADRDIIELDHAVFTSNRSISGQGYRVVAWSPGVTVEERNHLATVSPSHDSMCDSSGDTIGLSSYLLGAGRHCVARTIHAGREQTGRGGQRVLTQSFILTSEQYAGFQCNPFSVIQAVRVAEAFVTDHKLSQELEPIAVHAAEPASDQETGVSSANVFASGLDAAGRRDLAGLIGHAMGEGTLVAVGFEPADVVVEAVLLSVPVHLRVNVSFTIGMKFALSRKHRLCMVGRDMKHTKRVIAGQGIGVLESGGPEFPLSGMQSSWSKMVLDSLDTGRLEELLTFNGERFDDTDAETLEYAAELRTKLNHLDESPLEELLELQEKPESPSQSGMTRRAERDIRYAARTALPARLMAAPAEEVRNNWTRLLSLAAGDEGLLESCRKVHAVTEDLDPAPPGCDEDPDSAKQLAERIVATE